MDKHQVAEQNLANEFLLMLTAFNMVDNVLRVQLANYGQEAAEIEAEGEIGPETQQRIDEIGQAGVELEAARETAVLKPMRDLEGHLAEMLPDFELVKVNLQAHLAGFNGGSCSH